ncbi:MAG: hypothetical protein EOO54_10150 [Haliea sp.]|nr:MAG: hypothetical protein EOO54_10150 [Haliea sp.]
MHRVYAVGDLYTRDYSTFLQTAHGPVLFAARGAKGELGQRGDRISAFAVKGSRLLLQVGADEPLVVDLLPLLETLGEALRETLAPAEARD